MIACLNVPYFAAAVERRHDRKLFDEPIAIGGQPWEPLPVYAFSQEVAHQGVRPGMSLRLVHVLSPESHFMPATPPHYLEASGEVTDLLTDLTHLVEPEALWLPDGERVRPQAGKGPDWGVAFNRSLPARYTLDLESLPPAEALALMRETGKSLRQYTHLDPAIGLARSKFAAQVAASLARANHARLVEDGEERAFLSSRTIHYLPLDRETSRRLLMLGIRTLGQLADLPPASLQSQFSPALMAHYRQAQGLESGLDWHDRQAKVQPLEEEKQERVRREFDEPIADGQTVERVLRHMATELAGRLQARRLECREMALNCQWAAGGEQPAARLTRRERTADPGVLAESLIELFDRFYLNGSTKGGPDNGQRRLVSLDVVLGDLCPAAPIQLSLFEPPKNSASLDALVSAIAARHGPGALFRPRLTDRRHPLPERRFQLQELAPL